MLGNRVTVIVNVVEAPFWDRPSGASRLAHDLCRCQVQWGHRVYLVSKKLSAGLPGREVLDGITVIREESRFYPPPDPRNMVERMAGTGRAVRRILAETGFISVLHTHTPLHGAAAMRAVAGTGAVKVHSIHSPWLQEMRAVGNWDRGRSLPGRLKSGAARIAARYIESKCLKGADFVTAFSEFTRREISRDYAGVVRNKSFQVLPGWVDTDRFNPAGPRTDWAPELGREPRGPVFFTVRGLTRRNGLDMLIDAAGLLRKQGLSFEVVIGGAGPLRDELEARIRRQDLGDCVRMIGRIDDDRLPVLYRSCHAFVLPTVALECFGIIILEALASGKPVIATPVGAIPEVLGPVFSEGLTAGVSAEALAQGMLTHYSAISETDGDDYDPERLRAYVRENFSIGAGTERFRRLYESGPSKQGKEPLAHSRRDL